ncbi:hypothetical protein D3C71_1071290 [compost metagenome]
MAEALQVEIAADVAVEPAQQIEGELGGDPGGIVVRRFDQRRVLVQVDADQGHAIRTHGLAHRLQQCDGVIMGEVAERRAGEEHQVARGFALRGWQLHRLGEVGADRQHFDVRQGRCETGDAVQQSGARDFDRGVGDRVTQRVQQQLGLAAAAAAQFHHVQARADHLGDVMRTVLQQLQLGAGRVVLRLLGDLLEQRRTLRIVEVLGGQLPRCGGQATQDVGGDLVPIRLQIGQRLECITDRTHAASRARRRPANCHRADGAKKLR